MSSTSSTNAQFPSKFTIEEAANGYIVTANDDMYVMPQRHVFTNLDGAFNFIRARRSHNVSSGQSYIMPGSGVLQPLHRGAQSGLGSLGATAQSSTAGSLSPHA